jgi:hypothetical protein
MRFFATAATALALGGAALAEPPRAEPKQPAQQTESQPRPTNLILASAEPVHGAAEDAPAPVKRRVIPRVTSCRCGDPQNMPVADGQ